VTVLANDTAPVCGCCAGSGMHGWTPTTSMNDPRADWEGCTTCSERGKTWHRARRDGCTGYIALMARARLTW